MTSKTQKNPQPANPAEFQRMINQGMSLHQAGKLDEARQVYLAVLAQTKHFDALHLLGLIEFQEGRSEQAIAYYLEAIAINKQFSPVFGNLGLAYSAIGQLDKAIDAYKRSIQIDKKYALGYNNLGSLYWRLNQQEEALSAYGDAIRYNPNLSEAYNNRSNVFKDLARFKEAEADLEKALKLKKHFPEARWNLAFLQLIQGDFVKGWESYECRWDTPNPPDTRIFARPKWDGCASLNHKTIFIYDEQGLGDSVQFSRYIPFLTQLGANVIFETHGPLKPLMAGQFQRCQVMARGDIVPDFDYHQALMSLPFIFKMDSIGKIPFPHGYIRPHQQKVEFWKEKLGEKTQYRVGLVWAGRASHPNDSNRSLALELLATALVDGVDYICLQPEIREADAPFIDSHKIKTFIGEIQDFSDTAAICYHLDLVICVDTGILHLAAAMGKPTWGLIPFSPDWRWLTQRIDSPWYDKLSLFRQSQRGNWDDVLAGVKSKLLENLN